jgi:protein disulfide-isomerase A6
MKPPQLLRVVALVLFATGAAPAAAATREAVYQLTGANFDVLTSSGAWFIEFYAPWCGHCRQLAPVFEEAAQEAGTKMHFGKVDCDDEKELQRRFDVKSFPTLVL